MLKNTKATKLALGKETVRRLNEKQLGAIAGGQSYPMICMQATVGQSCGCGTG